MIEYHRGAVDPFDASSYGQPSGGAGYRDVFVRRARGELPEMESSRAAALRIKSLARPGDAILDVGCGVGHYLPALRRELGDSFSYVGVDVSSESIEAAREIFGDGNGITFEVGNAFELAFEDSSFDMVMSNNLLLHLPDIRRPLTEMTRVARRHVVIRTLIGDRSFRIKDVEPPESFGDDGEPERFAFYNIYSRTYVGGLLADLPGLRGHSIETDHMFDPERLQASVSDHPDVYRATRVIDGMQVNGYVILPWAFLQIDLE